MIFVGYQGIGKSTLAKTEPYVIDLESGNFYVDGKRPDNWFKMYCNVAVHLSQQGYDVFVSSHQVVRDCLLEMQHNENLYIVRPTHEIKDAWLERLRSRYQESGLEKDYRALMNAEDRYDENITELEHQNGFTQIVITDMEYSLCDVLHKARWCEALMSTDAKP